MTYKINSSIVLITGAAGSIGSAITQRFLMNGCTVIACDIDQSALMHLVSCHQEHQNRLEPILLDVTDEDAVNYQIIDILAKYKTIDTLVNNAGGNHSTLLDNTTSREWKLDLELNLNAAFYMSKAILPSMVKHGSGNIINIGSVNSTTIFGDPGYSAAKAGLINYTKFVATEYGPRGVRSNIVCPGSVKTKAWDDMLKQTPELYMKFSKLCSLGRIATPEDVAGVVSFLASSDAQMMNGSVLVVDGGLTAGIPEIMNNFTD
ncbi:SDR family oxidoreductase [Cysteiniphilum halobium]|uniref:SDR family oxidoreductase n=1 Tax=Cysteiniphilum halobium TaxID=2219059 RepID=UPI003F863B6F